MADYRFPGEHTYGNMVLEAAETVEALEQMKDIEVHDGDILIASYPKTGTTWMEELTWLVTRGGDTTEAATTPLTNRMLFLEFTQSYHNGKSGVEMLKSIKRPAIMKTHLPSSFFEKQIKEGRLKVIITIRNPKDTLISMFHFYRMNTGLGNFPGTWDDFFELYKAKHIVNGDYFDWYQSWLPYLDLPNVRMFHYEDMKSDVKKTIRELSEHLAKPVADDKVNVIAEYTDFKKMKHNKMVNNERDPGLKTEISPFIRKGQVADWKNYFSDEQSQFVDEEYNRKLRDQGITLKFE